jgi:hypothetical protein
MVKFVNDRFSNDQQLNFYFELVATFPSAHFSRWGNKKPRVYLGFFYKEGKD